MNRRVLYMAIACALSGNAAAQTSEDIKSQLDDAMRVIRELQERVKALEQQEHAPVPAPSSPTAAPRDPATHAEKEAPGVKGARVIAPQSAPEEGAWGGEARLEISGKVQLDFIYDFDRVDPDWNATLRPSTIPVNCPGDPGCGEDGETVFSVRQTSLGFKAFVPTTAGELKAEVSFDLFSTGGGQTSARLLNAWGALGNRIGLGQYYTLFMNQDAFPNVVDYWGPNGMVFVRNPQIRYLAYEKEGLKLAFSLEAPNAAIDTGKVADIDPALNVRSHTQWPDAVGKLSWDQDWGHFQVAGVLRSVGFETLGDDVDSDEELGWGVNVSGWLKVGAKNRLIGQVVYGEGIASYMNDGGVDLAPSSSLKAETVKTLGAFVYYDHYWNDKWSSSVGASIHRQDNTGGQLPTAYKEGLYASANILWYPAKNVLTGVEFLWGRLEQNDGESGDDFRVQFSGQYKY